MFDWERARAIIRETGRRRDWLAEKSHISMPHLNKLLLGTAKPSKGTVALLAMSLDVDLDELWAEDGESNSKAG